MPTLAFLLAIFSFVGLLWIIFFVRTKDIISVQSISFLSFLSLVINVLIFGIIGAKFPHLYTQYMPIVALTISTITVAGFFLSFGVLIEALIIFVIQQVKELFHRRT